MADNWLSVAEIIASMRKLIPFLPAKSYPPFVGRTGEPVQKVVGLMVDAGAVYGEELYLNADLASQMVRAAATTKRVPYTAVAVMLEYEVEETSGLKREVQLVGISAVESLKISKP